MRNDDAISTVLGTKNEHNHSADERQNEKRILRDSVKRKAVDDLTGYSYRISKNV